MEREYYLRLAAAYVRGTLSAPPGEMGDLWRAPLDAQTDDELRRIVRAGETAGVRLHRFKRTMDLPRVQRVLGILRGLGPASLLDIGSGRGAFLWPLLDTFPDLPITCVDLLDYRVADIMAVRAGGVATVQAQCGDATRLPFADGACDVVTLLEVLEHIPDTRAALAEVCRVAGRFIIISVPSKPDDNPEHIHLFDAKALTEMLREAGMARTSTDYVLNHLIMVARR